MGRRPWVLALFLLQCSEALRAPTTRTAWPPPPPTPRIEKWKGCQPKTVARAKLWREQLDTIAAKDLDEEAEAKFRNALHHALEDDLASLAAWAPLLCADLTAPLGNTDCARPTFDRAVVFSAGQVILHEPSRLALDALIAKAHRMRQPRLLMWGGDCTTESQSHCLLLGESRLAAVRHYLSAFIELPIQRCPGPPPRNVPPEALLLGLSESATEAPHTPNSSPADR